MSKLLTSFPLGYQQKKKRGAAASPPTDVEGLQIWIDFSDISTLYQDSGKTTPVASDGDPIGYAEDKSGQSYDFTQDTTANKPTYKTGIQNSLSVSRYDGTDYLRGSSSSILKTAANCTIFVVVKNITNTSVCTLYEGFPGSNGFGYEPEFHIGNGLSDNTDAFYFSDDSTLTPDDCCYLEYPHNGNFVVVRLVMTDLDQSTISGQIWENNSSQGTDTGNSITRGAAQPGDMLTIGGSETSSRLMTGDFAELLIYDSALSEINQSLVENYLNDKWSIY